MAFLFEEALKLDETAADIRAKTWGGDDDCDDEEAAPSPETALAEEQAGACWER